MLILGLTSLLNALLNLLSRIFRRSSAEGEITSPPTRPEDFIHSAQEDAIALTPEEYKSHIELYKFALEFAFKAITIFFLLVSAVLTFGLTSGKEAKTSGDLVTRILLITSFLVNIAMIVGFEVSTYLWICLSRRVNGSVKWRNVLWEPSPTWNKLAVKLYSPSLTLILSITTMLFIVFSILLGKIMAHHKVWFCPDCWLG
jgi:hypothetical protein